MKLTARGASIHAIFLLMVKRIQMFFSLNYFASQGESSLKISGHWGGGFTVLEGTSKHQNRQTHSLTDRLALLYSDCIYLEQALPKEVIAFQGD